MKSIEINYLDAFRCHTFMNKLQFSVFFSVWGAFDPVRNQHCLRERGLLKGVWIITVF